MYLLITGGFDPVHSGHLRAFTYASRIGKLIVGLNSDEWLIRKKGAYLLPYAERVSVVRNLKTVHDTIDGWDDDDGSACAAIHTFYQKYRDRGEVLAFANGGDRTPAGVNLNEFELCSSLGIVSIFGVGGDKTASSSNFLGEYVARMCKN